MKKLILFTLFITLTGVGISQCNLEIKYDAAGNRIFRGNVCNPDCSTHVLNSNDIGNGSLREAIYCANDGENITFDNSLANEEINLKQKLIIDKNININKTYTDYISIQDIVLKSIVDDIVLEIPPNYNVYLSHLNLFSNSGYNANPRILNNSGILSLESITLSDDAQFKGQNSTIFNTGSIKLIDILNHVYIVYQ